MRNKCIYAVYIHKKKYLIEYNFVNKQINWIKMIQMKLLLKICLLLWAIEQAVLSYTECINLYFLPIKT